jgi:hypothetical protein
MEVLGGAACELSSAKDANQTEDIMNDLSTCGALTGDNTVASRRQVVGAALSMAVAAGAATSAQAQASSSLVFSNPTDLSNSRGAYSHVVEVNGPHRTVYIAGQTGVSASGKIA